MADYRKLRTILFADIAGYTALMQKDERHALGLLHTFKDRLEQMVPEHRGEIIQYYGDGVLLAFDSATDGVWCGQRLQLAFREEQLPVRMGMHLGEVVFRNQNLFGDGVNIASRIESVGVPGSLLISKTVRDQLRNKSDFRLVSLGTFRFKNVTEPLEVFAVGNEGLVVPERKKMTGKTEAGRSPWPGVLGLVAGLGLLASLMLWGAGVWASKADTGKPGASLSDEIRRKRLVIMVFDNQTFNPEYDAFGKMISDWLTNGLMETGEANIINAANIAPQIDRLSTGSEVTPEFVSATGVDMMLKGRYYLMDDRLAVQANLIDARNGEVIHAMDPIRGDRDDLSDLLRLLTQEILGYWAVKDRTRFLENPPTYDAYQEWLEADRFLISEPDQAVTHLRKAFALDSSFFEPLINLYQLYGKEGDFGSQDSVYEYLAARTGQFTRWEKLRFIEIKAIRNRDWETLARSAERRYRMDSSDQKALDLAVTANNLINFPSRSLDLIRSFDTIYVNRDLYEISWLETNQIFPNIQLGEYKTVDEIATRYNWAKIPDAIAVLHLKALVHLDSLDRLNRFFNYYKLSGLYNNSGKQTPFYSIAAMLCDELLITGKTKLLEQYTGELKNLLPENERDPYYYDITGYIHFYSSRYRQAARAWENHRIRREDWPGWLWQTLEYDRLSRIGHCYARLMEMEQAETYRERLTDIQGEHSETPGNRQYYQARILAAEGRLAEAIQSLQQAIQEGFHFYGPVRFSFDPFLLPLFGEPAFLELVEPK